MSSSAKEPGEPRSTRGPALGAALVLAAAAVALTRPVPALDWLLLVAACGYGVAALDHALLLSLRARARQRSADGAEWVDVATGLLPAALVLVACWAHWREWAAADSLAVGGLCWLGYLALVRLALERVRCLEQQDGLFERLAQAGLEVLQPGLRAAQRLIDRRQPPVAQAEAAAVAEAEAEEELADAIEAGSHEGDLSLVQSELLRRELDLAHTLAAEVMVPRVKVVYLDLDHTWAEAAELVRASRHSRFPVQRHSVDDVVAVLHAKDLLRWRDRPPATIRKLLALVRPRPPVRVAHDLPLDDVLALLRRERVSLALVDDAYGGVAGIITVEDVVEELVGEIIDESDTGAVAESLTCSGRRRLSELAEQGLVLPGEPGETVAEFLAARLAEPAVEAVWDAGPLRLTVLALDAEGAVETVALDWTVAPGEPR